MIVRFGSADDPLVRLSRDRSSKQVDYLRCYLHDLEARTVLIEPNYFDRDYLSEFTSFYGSASLGYPNVCERAHFFSSRLTRKDLKAAAAATLSDAEDALGKAYLGHVILRPLRTAPLGRTVLKWYPDNGPSSGTPRVIEPARDYESHVAGLRLTVRGLAWQQQDSAVGACATIALWSMLHSSAFDDHHPVPTTAAITAAAHRKGSGSRVFPASSGLSLFHMLEAIKEHGLSPVLLASDEHDGFSGERFCTLIASLVRSGYPAVLNGHLDDGTDNEGHAVCVVGFRPATEPSIAPGDSVLADGTLRHLYVHDDNLGPGVRFKISTDNGVVELVPDAPVPRRRRPVDDPTIGYGLFRPTEIIAAVHDELRTDPSELQEAAIKYAPWFAQSLQEAEQHQGLALSPGTTTGSRFFRWHRYVQEELARVLSGSALARARLACWEKLRPLSLHIGVVRVASSGIPIMDILFDTSDSARHLIPVATIAFHEQVPWLLARLERLLGTAPVDLGRIIEAW